MVKYMLRAFFISDDVQYNATERIFIGLFRTIQSVFVDFDSLRCKSY